MLDLRGIRRRMLPGWHHAANDDGQSVAEVAITLSVMLILIYGVCVLGYWGYYRIEISNAAHAGALCGMNSCSAGVPASAQADAPDLGTNMTVSSTTYYACASDLPTSYTSASAASSACSSSQYVELISVTTKAKLSSPLTTGLLSFTSGSQTLTATSVMEVLE